MRRLQPEALAEFDVQVRGDLLVELLGAPGIAQNSGGLQRVARGLRADAVVARDQQDVLQRHRTVDVLAAPRSDRITGHEELGGERVRAHLLADRAAGR